MKKLILFLTFMAATVMSAEDVLLKSFTKEITCGSVKYGSVQTEYLENGAKITIKPIKDKKNDPTHIQLICVYEQGLKAETSYKITFTVKASSKCKISGGFIGDRKPWTYFVHRWYTLLPDTARTESIEFTPEKDTGAIRTPCLFLGELPVGTIFTITDVKLFEIR